MKFNRLIPIGISCLNLKVLRIMKLTLFLLLVCFFQSAANTYGQRITLSENNAPLHKVLKQLRVQSGYDFLYNSSLIRRGTPVSVDLKNVPLEEALKTVLQNQSLSYTIKNNAVVIKEAVVLPVVIEAATLTVRGKVVDDEGIALIGVTVKVKGSAQGVSTNANGDFTLSNVDENALIQISYIGYETREIRVKAEMGVIRLERSNSNLDELVVIGYGTARKGDITGSIATLKPDEMEASKAVSLDNLIQGKVAGVAVSAGIPLPGAAPNITIRGANSLRGDNQPLFVVDNIPLPATGSFAPSSIGGGDFEIPQNPLASLSPSDIEDIQILKDASATAIYGSRGANGVILITTKKGKTGLPKINFNTTFTVVEATRLRDMLTLDEYAEYRNEKSGAASYFFKEGNEMRYVFGDAVYDPNDPETYNVVKGHNWQKEIYGNGLSQSYNLSISGGSDKIRYYLAGDYKDINGLVKQTGLRQGSLRLNLGGNLSRNLTFNTSLTGSLRSNNMMAGGNTKGGATGAITRTAIDSAPFVLPPDDPALEGNDELRTTALAWLTDYDDITTEKTLRASADLTWQILKNFSYTLRTGGNLMLQDRTRWYNTGIWLGLNNNGYLGNSNLNSNNYTFENLVNYNTKIGRTSNVSATAGVTYDDYNWLNKSILASDFEFKDLGIKGLHMASNQTISSPQQLDYQLLSYLARLNFSLFNGKYIVTATGRADGSSKFSKENRWAFFPSAAIAWKLDEEELLSALPWLNELKLRVGYGKTGSQSISPYTTVYDYAQNRNYASAEGDPIKAVVVSNLSNSALKWESTSAYNAGVDFNLWEGRLGGSFEVYMKETNDLLVNKNIPASTGFAAITVNQGALSNKGVELALNSEIIRNKDFSWNLSANIGTNKRKVLSLGSPYMDLGAITGYGYLGNAISDHFGVGNIFLVGEAPGLFYGYKTDGIIQSEDIDLPTSTLFNMRPGEIKVVDVTGDGVIDAKDMTIIGDPNPDFNYGFQTSVGYKRVKLSATFYGVKGGEILNANIRYEQTPALNTPNVTRYAYANAWRQDAPSNLFPSVLSSVKNYVYDRYIEDGSFLRCSDITLSYVVPARIVKNFNVFGSVKNAFLITDYSGYDPEMRTFSFDGLRPGIDINSFSNPRQFVLGLNVTF